MGVFMKRLLGMFLIFALSSFVNVAAMEYGSEPEGAFPQDIIEQMRREEEARQFQQIEQQRRQEQQARRQEYLQRLRQNRNAPDQPVQRQLNY
jgi:hypothetical protein